MEEQVLETWGEEDERGADERKGTLKVHIGKENF